LVAIAFAVGFQRIALAPIPFAVPFKRDDWLLSSVAAAIVHHVAAFI
jgi:hypothetical protein